MVSAFMSSLEPLECSFRKRHDIVDAVAIEQQHDQPVHPKRNSGGGGKPGGERREKVFIERIADFSVPPSRIVFGLEAFALFFRLGQLSEPVGKRSGQAGSMRAKEANAAGYPVRKTGRFRGSPGSTLSTKSRSNLSGSG